LNFIQNGDKKMKRLTVLLAALVMVFGLSISAQATLYNRGTDTLGYRLIYDSDLKITWYDYTYPGAFTHDYWVNAVNWADALSVNFGGIIYNDWRLPLTTEGSHAFRYDGTTTFGYNITSSELGHLYYIELDNVAYYDTLGNGPQAGYDVTKTGEFQQLRNYWYWSGTEVVGIPDAAYSFQFGTIGNPLKTGLQEFASENNDLVALAVRPGDVAPVPEPSTMLLLGSGLIGLLGLRKKFKN
jgi:hypothetical protein